MDILAHCRQRLNGSGLVVLDAHKNAWDILLTARFIRLTFNPRKIIMPIAGYVFFVPILKQLVGFVAFEYKITFVPVYRRVEYRPTHLLMKLLCMFYPKYLTKERRERANSEYIKLTIRESKKPSTLIIVAPYGSPLYYGGKIKHGVVKLLESKSYAMVSHSMWSWKLLKFRTILGHHKSDLLAEYLNLTRKS
jgi:hypothetical protein